MPASFLYWYVYECHAVYFEPLGTRITEYKLLVCSDFISRKTLYYL